MSISHARDMDPRIRILSCDAPERPRRRFDWRLPAAAVLVAGVGIGVTLAVTSVRQPPALTPVTETAPVTAEPLEGVFVMASADAASFRPTRQLHTSIRDAVTVDLRAAARVAQPEVVVEPPSPTSSDATVTLASEPASSTTAVRPPASPETSAPEVPASGQSPSGVVSEPVQPGNGTEAVGPENAPGAGNPVAPQ